MSRFSDSQSVRRFMFVGAVFAVAVVFFLLPKTRISSADGPITRTASHEESFPNYDIRTDKFASGMVASFRSSAGKSSPEIADSRDAIIRGEESLRQRVPTLKVEYSSDLKTAEVIAPDIKQGKAFLTRPSRSTRADVLKNFLSENSGLIGARGEQISNLKVFSDYTNPDGKLSFVELNQEISGIPVFRGEVKAGFTPSGEMIRIINNLAPGLDEASLPTDFGDAADALRSAAGHIDSPLARTDSVKNANVSTALKVVFGSGDSSPTAEKMYFPTEPGVAVAAWRVLIWQPVNAYYVIVEAKTGTMLWRKNITEDQTQAATYNVYANPTAMVNVADSPFPMSPGPSAPNGVQGAAISRTMITRVGNEAPYTFNNLGWITDGGNTTDGNNVQAGLDREAPNNGSLNADAIDPTSIPAGSPNRVFDFAINPAIPTSPAINTGDAPLPTGQNPGDCLAEGTAAIPTEFQKAAVTQLFYISNVYHDELYRLGFTEQARNFQNDNFGRGGLGGDRISAQAQDCSGVNNANFATPADGGRPQMQMYLWPGPNPDIDGSLDAEVIIHEITHGTSNRLHGNGSGLMLDIARGMGEGWSDFYGQCLLSEPTDPIDGIYTTGAYDTYLFGSVGLNNYYYGIRRFPKAIKSKLGGLQNRPHNPLTFADIDITKMDLSDGAYSPRFVGTADQVHAIGEVWSIALWEIRARMIQRLGWEIGNRRVLQIVTDGMKLAPLGPTPISERDAIIAGVFASGDAADLADVWAGFALRGLGATASIENVGGLSTGGTATVRVTESFDLPNLDQTPVVSVSDSPGDNDGFAEPGEAVIITIPFTNSTGATASDVLVRLVGGGTESYGTLTGISTATRSFAYSIPVGATCGSSVTITLYVTSSLGQVSFERRFLVGKPETIVASENFDGVASTVLPGEWTAFPVAGGVNFQNSTLVPDSGPNAVYARNPTTIGGGTDLTSPQITVTSPAATLTFRNSYNTEAEWDGGVLEISIAGAPFKDFVAAGGIFTQNGYNDVLGGGRNNPIANREAWSGNSNGYVTTVAQLPPGANGKLVQLRWRFGADDNTAGTGANPGWFVDSIVLSGAGIVTSFRCLVTIPPLSISGRVVAPDGRPLRNLLVGLTDSVGTVRRVTTSSFGLYSFDSVLPFQTYTLTVGSRRYRFSAQLVSPTGNLTNFDLMGQE